MTRWIYHLIRLLLAAALGILAAAKFGFVAGPQAGMFSPEAWAFMQTLEQTGYMWPAIGGIAAVCAVLFFVNKYVALAAIVFMPISVNMVLFHAFLDNPLKPTAYPAYALLVLLVVLLLLAKERIDPLLTAKS